MELKLRKRINNLPKFDIGQDAANLFKLLFTINKPVYTNGSNVSNNVSNTKLSTGNSVLDIRNNVSSLSFNKNHGSIGGDLTGMQSYKQNLTSAPTKEELSSLKTPSVDAGGATSNISASAVTGAVNGTLGMISGYSSMQDAVKGPNELMAYSGQRTDLAFGVNYQSLNDINGQKAMDDISRSNRDATLGMVGSGAAAGAAIGSVVPGVGTLIGGAAGAIVGLFGGLFGSKKAREKLRRKVFNAQLKVNLVNLINQSSAATEGLTLQYYLDNGNTYDDILYANRGKDLIKPRYVKRK